ncbi:MAG: tRNA uridine-5-carboxymethylaminomethyl(34) synthesis GTPase MnmE [Lachnospiraceae bacterium]|nr:tRNA uridine-5-carboxymethylaminomethyl(34) synthesis GTPase MnmE [Lachnospiraceae bacterium]
MRSDTIAAIATAMNPSGIGIVRISGEEAFDVAGRIFRTKKGRKDFRQVSPNTIHYGYIYDGEELIDEVLLMVMKGPHSYTAEDTVEIDCHGGILVMKKILDAALQNGASLAEPGEFTKRAFLNGRIDLSQAEAVVDLINAKNRYAMASSLNQLKGRFSEKIRQIRKEILYHMAYIESALDDPEHISFDGYPEKLVPFLEETIEKLEIILRESENGKMVKEGIRTVILGRPNVGKSSILNLLLGEERAIVTNIAGTTRDTLEEHLMLNGISLNLVDTAGIRETEDKIEKIGVDRARTQAEEADLILLVVDSSRELEKNDYEMIDWLQSKNSIILLNKTDLPAMTAAEDLRILAKKTVISFSAKEGIGIKDLISEIQNMFFQGKIVYGEDLYLANTRQKENIQKALVGLRMVRKSVEEGMPEDFYSIDFMDAYEQLGYVLGEAVEEDLVNEIFQRFCMGK